ncbi:MAG: phosphomethylpyrimidine synthase ThiC [Desulfomonilia bacterium]
MTQKQLAQKGTITPEMRTVAEYEGIDPGYVRDCVSAGTIVIPKNKGKTLCRVRGIGKGLRTKVNANIGSSPYHMDIHSEIEKLHAAVAHGADAVMDLSLGSRLIDIRREVVRESPVMVGTVPIYQTAFELSSSRRDITDMTIRDFLETLRSQAEEGVDFMTIHSGVTLQALKSLSSQRRVLDVVSRGGSFLAAWMRKNNRESPLYEHYDEILDILAAYDVTLSLGDGMRPGAVSDATDCAQISELVTLAELARRAWDKGVQVIIEGPGHVPMSMIHENIRLQKSLCKDAPFYVLGPLVTDCAAGYDHIAGAIGGAMAAYFGADFLCYVTPAEHLRLPTVEHVVEGVVASRIAAHAADLARGMGYARERDKAMSRARKHLDWDRQTALSLDPLKAKSLRESSGIGMDNVCTMCGKFCAIKRMHEVL